VVVVDINGAVAAPVLDDFQPAFDIVGELDAIAPGSSPGQAQAIDLGNQATFFVGSTMSVMLPLGSSDRARSVSGKAAAWVRTKANARHTNRVDRLTRPGSMAWKGLLTGYYHPPDR